MKNLCKSIMFMQNGRIIDVGRTEDVINTYLSSSRVESNMVRSFSNPGEAPGNELVKMKRMEVCPHYKEVTELIDIHTPINIEFEFWNYVTDKEINLSLHLYTVTEECVFNVGTDANYLSEGLHKGVCEIPAHLLNDGAYSVSMMVVAEGSYALYNFEHQVSFEINENRDASGWHGKHPGLVRPKLNFPLKKIS